MASIFHKLNKSLKKSLQKKKEFLHKPSFKGAAQVALFQEHETQKYFSGSHVLLNQFHGKTGETLRGVHNGLNMAAGSVFTAGASGLIRGGLNALSVSGNKAANIFIDIPGRPGGQTQVGEGGFFGDGGGGSLFSGGGLQAAGEEIGAELKGDKAPVALLLIAAVAVVAVLLIKRK